MIWLYILVVLLNAFMLTLVIVAHTSAANVVIWSFATTMWVAAAVQRYRSRAQ